MYPNRGGRPLKPEGVRRQDLILKYSLSESRNRAEKFPVELLDQVDRCKSEAARRLILGRSR